MAIFPTGNTENIMYSTVLLRTKTGSGTGFFYEIDVESRKILVLVTNKHVVNNNTKEVVTASFHTGDNVNKVVDDSNIEITLNVEWIFHPTQDLCITPFMPIFYYVEEKINKKIFFRYISSSMIWNNTELTKLETVENVLMVGYPIGLWDKKNNLPLFRRGVTANHPAIDFNKESIGVVDMACFPGSSGSPIFLYNDGTYLDKNTKSTIVGTRLIFLGILYAGPQMNVDGKITITEIPTNVVSISTTPVMINLGYYVKAKALSDFVPILKPLIPPATV